MKILSRKFPKIDKLCKDQEKQLFYEVLLVIFLEGYMEFLVTSQLNLTHPLMTTDGEIFSTITSVVNGTISVILIPCLTLYIIVRRKVIITDKMFI